MRAGANDSRVRAVCRRVFLATLCFLFVALPARSELVQDGGGWIIMSATGDFERVSPKLKRLRYWFDTQVRFLEDADGFSQSIVRPALGWSIFEGAAVWLGYEWLHTSNPGLPSTNEQQVWEQFTWSGSAASFTLLWRTRLEQRFRINESDVGLRLRQRVKATHPIHKGSAFSIAAYDEVFFHLKNTDWGTRSGFGQNRAFLGLAWNLEPEIASTIEFGYLNQYIYNRGRPDRMNHLVTLTVAFH